MDVSDTCLPFIRIPSKLYRVVLQDMTKAQRGLLLSLLCYCALCRNGGRIKGCRNWTRAKWTKTMQIFCNISEEVQKLCNILAWDGDDLLVLAYPAEDEMKASAHAGSRPAAVPRACAGAPASPRREENRTEREECRMGPSMAPHPAVPHDLDEVMVFAATLPGSMPAADAQACANSFFHGMQAVGWRDTHGRPILNWQAAFRAYHGKWSSNLLRRPAHAPISARPTCNHNSNAGHADEYDI